MRLLVLGGGGFLGFHVVAEAVAAGHEVTVFSRSGRAPLPGVAVLTGDRQGDLSALSGRDFDGVVDTFTDPDPGAPAVASTARLLEGRAGAYAYVSGMSVYAPDGPAVPDETAPVRRAGREPDGDPLQARSIAKLAGEDAVRDAFSGAVLLPRVGIMVGPRDPSSRFTTWPLRLRAARLGSAPRTVAVPGDPDRAVQYSDARDIAGWIVRMVADARGGVFNAVGPGRPDPLRSVLADCARAAGVEPGDVLTVVVPEGEARGLLEGVPEEERPLWWPEDQIPQAAIDSSAALAAGLVFRPAAETAADVLAWALEAGDEALLHGAFASREAALVAAGRPAPGLLGR